MFFCAIRVLFVVICVLAVFVVARRVRAAKAKKNILYFVGIPLAVCCLICWYVPVENAFIDFRSPQSAYRYSNTDEIALTVEGKQSALVVGQGRDDTSYTIVRKSNKGFKENVGLKNGLQNVNTVFSKMTQNEFIDVYNLKGTDDYYIIVKGINENPVSVADNRGSEFYEYRDSVLGTRSYFVVVDSVEGYVLEVGGEKYRF